MSSVANNHVAFAQQADISSQKLANPCNAQMAFYKEDCGGGANAGCYPTEPPPMRPRQLSYANAWSPLPAMNPSQWNEMQCDTTTPHIGGLPAAHSLLAFPTTSSSSTVTNNLPNTTDMENRNGKNFTPSTCPATSIPTYPPYADHQKSCQPHYTLKRGSLYTSPRATYHGNTNGAVHSMEYADVRGELYHNKSTTTFQSPSLSPHDEVQFLPYQYDVGRRERSLAPVSGLTADSKLTGSRDHPSTDSAACSRSSSLDSSEDETTASSSTTRRTSSLSFGATATTSLESHQKRPRKPAPTLATGRRNLKSEPVGPDEADRRMKRRERNRKSAQKCRERKLHRTQELQAQVEALNMEASRLLREIEGIQELNRHCVRLLQQHCPGVAIPYMNSVLSIPEGYSPPAASAPKAMPLEHERITFCDTVEQIDTRFFHSTKAGSGPNFCSLGSVGWNGGNFSPVAAKLPPLSQFVPKTPIPPSPASVAVKSEPRPGPYWKGSRPVNAFMSNKNSEKNNETPAWRTENDTDSSPGCELPPQLRTPNQMDDKSNTCSQSSSQ